MLTEKRGALECDIFVLMKQRIRNIFILMVACILGINFFQGYWLYNSYQVIHRNLAKGANEALFQALKQQELADAVIPFTGGQFRDSVRYRHLEAFSPDSLAIFDWSADTSRITGADPSFRILRSDSIRAFQVRVAADTLAREISSLLILNKFYERAFDLERFDSLYQQALQQKDIDAVYRLDTFHLDQLEHSGPGEVTSFGEEEPSQALGSITTTMVPVNLLSRLFIRATFPHPRSLILGRMAGLLAGSFLLFLLTTGALVYMLRTILAQKKLSEIKNDFINNMTHELKTPIATVSAAVEALRHFDALEDRRRVHDYLEISHHELERLSDLVEKVLNMAVEERSHLDLHPEAVDVVALIRHLAGQHQLRAVKPVTIDLSSRLSDPLIMVDKTHFTNAINNLLDNAIKYSYDSVNINIHCDRDGNWLRVAIRDNGIGIPADYQQRIFEQFFRVPSGDLHNVKGFGLGLAYVRKIIEKHGGRISVVSEPYKGSEFVITLPV